MAASMLSIGFVVLSSIIGAFGGFIFKKASAKIEFNFYKLIENYGLYFGLFLYALAAMIYIIALKGGSLNTLYPISSITYVWSTLIAKKKLGEEINKFKWAGIVLIILGSVFIVN